MTKHFVNTFLMGAAALSLSACEGAQMQFDFSKKAPDEFAVMTRAPLEMPPDYTLRPPQPGAPRPQEQSATNMAREAVLGPDAVKQIAKDNQVSAGEAVLLQKTGAANVNPAIRSVVDRETAEIAEDETPGIDTLKKMVGKDVKPPAKVVDPVAETNRIKANKAAGKPVTAGETPTKED
jgi:hypothetical protein